MFHRFMGEPFKDFDPREICRNRSSLSLDEGTSQNRIRAPARIWPAVPGGCWGPAVPQGGENADLGFSRLVGRVIRVPPLISLQLSLFVK